MAPLERRSTGELEKSFTGVLRPRDAAMSAATSPSMYLGLGVGVGGAILVAILIVVVKIIRKHRQHRRLIEAQELEEAVRVARAQEIGKISRPDSVARCSTFAPLNARAGWGALSSSETIDEPQSAGADKRKRLSVSLPKRIKRKSIPLKRLKRLTAILESPRSRNECSPVIARPTAVLERPEDTTAPAGQPLNAYTLHMAEDGDVFVCPGSPKPDVLPSFAIRSPGRYGAGIANIDVPRAAGSRSVGALIAPGAPHAVLQDVPLPLNVPMHVRSVSIGAPPTRPPSCPVPLLPVIEPQSVQQDTSARQDVCVGRLSTSSQGSAGSSVLITSPILTMHDQSQSLGSRSVQDVVAGDDNASLKTVTTNRRPTPSASKPTRLGGTRNDSRSEASIRSNIARYSVESRSSSQRLSSTSLESQSDKQKRFSVPHIGLAHRISISRVSPTNSLGSNSGVQKIVTPRKATRTSVSSTGSPAERRKTSVLHDISANSHLLFRQLSNATQNSSNSSNGNPFQWDQPLPKPSALKGSPNARKGHRRQNCVRISTLIPQILGPPPSRSTSPSIMHGIEEESDENQEATDPNKLRFVSNQHHSRPPSAGFFAPDLSVQTLRASLTPSSPTLSAWNAYQEYGFPSMPSDSQLSISASPATRTASRQSHSQSDRSSAFIIPSFPSPIRATVSPVQLSQPVPQFCLSRPSTDIEDEDSSSPFALRLSSDQGMPSSPPLSPSVDIGTGLAVEYDPTLPPMPKPTAEEYDPASPMLWDATEPERSSTLFPFATTSLNAAMVDDGVSPRTVPNSYGGDLPDTPPCSPKTMPQGFQAFFENKSSGSKPPRTSEDKLTSENASQIMSRLPTTSSCRVVDFPGAPILPPPHEPEGYAQTTPERVQALQPPIERSRAISNAAPPPAFNPLRSTSAPPMPTIPSSSFEACSSPPVTVETETIDIYSDPMDVDMPSPLHLGTANKASPAPQGPRNQPPCSVLKSTQALRRMNSEANSPFLSPSPSASNTNAAFFADENRESRRYVRMGREASPLLPWIGSPDPSESCSDLGGFGNVGEVFDFGFTAPGAEEGDGGEAWASAMDEIDFTEVERKLDGALAGFEPLAVVEEAEAGTFDTVQGWRKEDEQQRNSSVWEDGEKFWELPQGPRTNRMADVSMLPGSSVNTMTPKKDAWNTGKENVVPEARASIQMTPRSFYDSDGFLRT